MSANRLLILDDDPLTGQTIRNIAALAGFGVELTANHTDFFAALVDWQPDVIALDLVMPEMDGVEVIAELARRNCICKIIITSGVGGRVLDAAGRSATERGLDIIGVLPKPFTPASLRELLAKCPPPGSLKKSSRNLDEGFRAALSSKTTPQELVRAIKNHEIHLCYQPKVGCKSGVLSGFEALARWTHPLRGVIPPDEFIPLAEEHQLIDMLTNEILDQALLWFRNMLAIIRAEKEVYKSIQDPDGLTLSINISALSLSNMGMFDRLMLMCRDLEIEPQSLIFELTETSAMEDPVSSLELLTRLRLRGFRLSIDDFGTGYSSMLQLVKLPFSELKVDKSFVSTAKESEESRVVIKSIVSLAMSLGLIVTAEGIEDEETLNFLRNIGCTLAQGYHISRPMPGAMVMDWLAARNNPDEQRRLDSLHELGILDTPPEERFDALIRLTKQLLKIPMVAFTLVDSERLWFKSRSGVSATTVLRAGSFCAHTIEQNRVCVINDTLHEPVFARNPLVQNPPHIRFYAGCPVHAADGSNIGTLILLDTVPRLLSGTEIEALQELATMVERELYAKPAEHLDETTRVLTHQAMQERLTEILALCRNLQLSCTLNEFELMDLLPSQVNEVSNRNHYVLTTFARMLTESYTDATLIGRFDRDKFITLNIENDEKVMKLARWKLESAVLAHNQHAISNLEIHYQIGTASTRAEQDYALQSLLDMADQSINSF
jgi:EAL domain-containing protein (putative c-di-GMP-specific phosphodiesterase class I)/GGDEF domain-containing protein